MNGIERLRELARRRDTLVVPPVHGMYGAGYVAATEDMSERLSDIADQIEREQVELVADSPYDAILPEDRGAMAWVREHGGLEMVSLDLAEGTAFGGIVDDIAARLGVSVAGLDSQDARDRVMSALDRRLVPEGMEWPKVDGKPVDFVTGYEPSLGVLEAVSIYNNGACEVMSHDGIVKNAMEVHVLKPKVLDADGVEIREGDTVWHVETGEQCKVVEVNSKSVSVDFHVGGDGTKHTGSILPVNLAHRAPVLAADGKPLRVGEHVYHVETGTELVVKRLPKPGEYQAVVVFALPASPASHLTSFDPDYLTHERPDSWELLEEDAGCTATKYNERRGTIFTTKQQVARDLVRRARALAERDA